MKRKEIKNIFRLNERDKDSQERIDKAIKLLEANKSEFAEELIKILNGGKNE